MHGSFNRPNVKFIGGCKENLGCYQFCLDCFFSMHITLTKAADKVRTHMNPYNAPSSSIKTATLALFAVTGIPQAATYSIPFALASMYSSDAGAGHDVCVTNQWTMK